MFWELSWTEDRVPGLVQASNDAINPIPATEIA
jgi:hypothetical protein